MQIMEKRTERREYNYFGSTFDLNTGELLKLTDLTEEYKIFKKSDISREKYCRDGYINSK